MLKSIAVAVALLAGSVGSIAHAEDSKPVRSISISGHGEVRAIPDLAIVSIGVSTQAATARDALDANTKAMKALLDTLNTAEVDSRDISTSNFSVGPRYDYNNNNQPPKVIGYDVNNMVTVMVRKIDELGELLDIAVSSGSNQINGISFNVSKPEAMLDEARKLAVADARHKAEIYAAASGFKIGSILSLNEATAMPGPVTYMAKAERAPASSPVPIAQGEQALSVDVSITYQIE